jgi:hypothetical protein
MTNSAVLPEWLVAVIGMGVKPTVFPFAERTRATFALESMLIEYSPAGSTFLPH